MAKCEKCGRPLMDDEEQLCPSCRKPWSEVTKTASEAGELATESAKLAKIRLKSLLSRRSEKKS